MTPPTVSARVLEFAVTKIRHVVGRGECWDLANQALQAAGAMTPNDLGSDLYVWGTVVGSLADAQPGDILQFEGVTIYREWEEAAGTRWEEVTFNSRHTAIVRSVGGGLFFDLIHCNFGGSRRVAPIRLNLSPENIRSGSIIVYRPQPRR